MNPTAGFGQTFNYSLFQNEELAQDAQDTLGNFKTFLRHTFDGIIVIGQELQEIYDQCLQFGASGKKVFKQWLESRSFGASIYIAKSAMQLYNWFKDLDPRLQRLIRENVQDWKVSALRHLKHLADDVIETVVTTGKKTASQLKQLSARITSYVAPAFTASSDNQESVESNITIVSAPKEEEGETREGEEGENNVSLSLALSPTPTLAPGVRVIVTNDTRGYNNHSGIITQINDNDDIWVLLDNTVAQGNTTTTNLYKSNQLKLGQNANTTPKASVKTLTNADIEQIKAEAIKQYQLEQAELEQGRYLEIKNGALSDAKKEIASYQIHAQNMTNKVSELVKHLEEKEQEIARLQSLNVENLQLQQRVTELENALLNASKDSWGNTFNVQAAKVMNKDVEKKAELLVGEVERLKASIQEKDALLAQMQQNLAPDSDAVISELGEIGASIGWNGWNRSGYRDSNGTLHKGISAISAFVSDLTREFQQEAVF